MEKLQIKFENCYGIKKLDHEFDFSKNKIFAIYAPNGAMKTSFANTFTALLKGQQAEDRIYKNRKTICLANTESGKELDKEKIFVIAPMDEEFKTNKMSTLLVNKTLKEKYDSILLMINDKREKLIKALKATSGLKKDVEETLADDITHEKKKFFLSLESLSPRIEQEKESAFTDVKYAEIFNQHVINLLESTDFKEKLSEYILIYDQLTNNSQFFRKGVFNHTNAQTIAKNLHDQGFLKAGHSVYINTKNGKVEAKDLSELENAIQEEMSSILTNESLLNAFNGIDKKISSNANLREFRDYIEKNKFILPELKNLPSLKQKLWVAYLGKNYNEYKELLSVYEESKKEINDIIEHARLESTKWHKVVETFNKRFSVPFVVEIDNQDDVVLKEDAPIIRFKFNPSATDPMESVEEESLWRILSNGERRALYLLNIIFEVNARIEANQETLFVIDDIADSFDYKNKYAIIEYLNDITKKNYFYQIILTHNFDFYRTVSSRLGIARENRFHVEKSDTGIVLIEERYQNNPFDYWKKNLSGHDEMLIASIPFVRNLAEYCNYDDHFDILTSLLHFKKQTKTINIGKLQEIFKEILNLPNLSLKKPTSNVYDLIYDLAIKICNEKVQIIELEKKIVLAIAIRLRTEEFLIEKINDNAFIATISRNQTKSLIDKYKEKFSAEVENIKLFEKVNLMTPENIHLNSFMYEPILDMDNGHLKALYIEIDKLSSHKSKAYTD